MKLHFSIATESEYANITAQKKTTNCFQNTFSKILGGQILSYIPNKCKLPKRG